MKKRTISKKVVAIKLLLIVLIGTLLGVSCFFSSAIENALGIGVAPQGSSYADITKIKQDDLVIHYLSVGQGDCTFICLPDGTNMMIDASLSSKADDIIDYVKDLGVTQIDYFILTHSDSDHSGGAKKVFDAFEIKNVYRPFEIAMDKNDDSAPYADEKLASYYTGHLSEKYSLVTTNVYRNFISSAYSETYTENGVEKQATVTVSYDGLKILTSRTGIDFKFEFFAPLVRSETAFDFEETETYGYPTKIYDGASSVVKNSCSGVMLLEYKEKSFLFTGDATNLVEADVIDSLTDAEKERFKNVDVFQAGHHGAETSNSEEFLNLIKPTYIVVSCGLDNKYKHPSEEFLKRVEKLPHLVNDYLVRTDTMGNIVFGFSDENKLVYYAAPVGSGKTIVIFWWEIALGIFVVATVVIISTKFTKNIGATAKRAVKNAKKYK